MILNLFHASKVSNSKGIKTTGLRRGMINSGYGEKPKHSAIYLYCIFNVDVACDMIDLFGEIDVYRIKNIDETKLIADEDSGASSWEDSIEKMGTCAYIGDIPVKDIEWVGRFKSENEYIAWAKMRQLMAKS